MSTDLPARNGIDRIADIWGDRTPHGKGSVWPARVDLHLDPGISAGDGGSVGAVGVPVMQQRLWLRHRGEGRPDGRRAGPASDVVNHGRLGPKGLYGSTPWASSPDRLTRPLIRDDGQLVETDWADRDGPHRDQVQGAAGAKGPLSHGFYTSRGSCSWRSTTRWR